MAGDRLRTVLRLRKLKEQQALAEVAVSQNQLEQARRNLEERRAAQVVDPVVEERAAVRIRAMQLAGLRAVELTDQARDEVNNSVRQLEDALEGWRTASAKTKSVERLDDRRRLEAAVVAMKSSQRSLDELVLLMRSQGLDR